MKIGLSDQLIAAPLTKAFEAMQGFSFTVQSPRQNSLDLAEGKLDAAFITPLDFARSSSNLSLHPRIALISHGATMTAQLMFRENMQTIETIAVFDDDSPYRMLAAILLNEVYDIECEFVEVDSPSKISDLLKSHSACFVEGDRALALSATDLAQMDIGEEWSDKTEAAFIHLVLAVRDDSAEKQRIPELKGSKLAQYVRPAAEAYAKENPPIQATVLETLLEYSYASEADDFSWDSLRVFFEYLYYYGAIEHIPGISFIES